MPSFVKAALLVAVVGGALAVAFVAGFASGQSLLSKEHYRSEELGVFLMKESTDEGDTIVFQWENDGRITVLDSDENNDGTLDSRSVDSWFGDAVSVSATKRDRDQDDEYESIFLFIEEPSGGRTEYGILDKDEDGEADARHLRIMSDDRSTNLTYVDFNLDGHFDRLDELDSDWNILGYYVMIDRAWRRISDPKTDGLPESGATLEGSGETVRFVDGEWVVETAGRE